MKSIQHEWTSEILDIYWTERTLHIHFSNDIWLSHILMYVNCMLRRNNFYFVRHFWKTADRYRLLIESTRCFHIWPHYPRLKRVEIHLIRELVLFFHLMYTMTRGSLSMGMWQMHEKAGVFSVILTYYMYVESKGYVWTGFKTPQPKCGNMSLSFVLQTSHSVCISKWYPGNP